MALDLSPYNVIVVVFGMEGCPACEAFIPQLLARAEAFAAAGHPIWIYDPTKPPLTAGVPIFIYDVAPKEGGSLAEMKQHEEIQKFADRHNVGALPTTLVMKRGVGIFRLEGMKATGHIDQTLQTALVEAAS